MRVSGRDDDDVGLARAVAWRDLSACAFLRVSFDCDGLFLPDVARRAGSRPVAGVGRDLEAGVLAVDLDADDVDRGVVGTGTTGRPGTGSQALLRIASGAWSPSRGIPGHVDVHFCYSRVKTANLY